MRDWEGTEEANTYKAKNRNWRYGLNVESPLFCTYWATKLLNAVDVNATIISLQSCQ
jgi:hypothetical protein